MATEATPAVIKTTFRRVENASKVKEYVLQRLSDAIYALPNLRSASVEIAFEPSRQTDQRYVVQVTLAASGTVLRVEDHGPDVRTGIDRIHGSLERRIRDWKGRVYFAKRRKAASHKEALVLESTRQPPADQTGLIKRIKNHETKPMFPEDAIEQMELLDHDFFFMNAESGRHNVVYRRKAGGYGLIEPANPGK
jgi:putative sigma-54 modulation protein